MLILGLADNHDAGAALVQDGRLVAACAQERIDRKKNSGAFPWGAIDAVLDQVGARYRDVDRVVVGTAFTPSWALRRFPQLHHQRKSEGGQFDPLLNAYVVYQSLLRRSGLHTLEVEACRKLLERRIHERGMARASVDVMGHHAAHAEAAYRSQPNPRCLILTVDAMGDGLSATVSMGRVGQVDRLWTQSGFAAVNTYYSRVTEYLGFRPNRHEGKITGLAAYAPPNPHLVEHFRSQLDFVGPGFTRTNYFKRQAKDDAFYSELADFSREEVASALQANLERAITAFVSHWVEHTEVHDVAVCGGIFANVKLNQRIAELDEVRSLWVFPNMGDGGLAVGAALAAGGVPPHALETLYLGPSYTRTQIARELHVAKLTPERPADLADRVAALLAEGKVVARFDGGMEFGPRALGNRTVLASPADPAVNDWLNARLQRSEFMPFAPVVLAEDAPRLFHGVPKAAQSARFMTVCFDCTDDMKRLAPGTVHVDGTARPQILQEGENPGYAEILRRFKARTGIPVLVNTSFNMHEEPIVCSPFDAIRAFKSAELDALIVGEFLVERGG
ncbi:MAG: hypothetical protein H6741_12230 [Alphaproteobacteria bacterium]|nr:hypothetical protein [Alphaproteobacteria bacterium]MCB9793481.1 hypothetical protein [Alphaproteobacteria bacterium]